MSHRGLLQVVSYSSLLLCISELFVRSSSVKVSLTPTQLRVFGRRLQCSQVSEQGMPLSDVASTDIESSDTAVESADWCIYNRYCNFDNGGLQLVSVQSVRQCHHPVTE